MTARFWQPMYAPSGLEPWFTSRKLMAIELSNHAAALFYRHVHLLPIARPAANDRDHCWW